jgi:YVTN family beta-propeller protein
VNVSGRPNRRLGFGGAALALLLLLVSCRPAVREPHRLPTGAILDPAGPSVALGSMPVAMVFSPDSQRIVAVLSGYREQGAQVIDCASRRVVQTITQRAAFIGACFAPDGRTLFVSGGNRDLVYVYAWRDDSAALADSIAIGPGPDSTGGRAYPAGLACSPDGARLYVAENLADSLAVVDLASKRVTQHLPTGRYPFGVVVDRAGKVYASAWGASWIATFAPTANGLEARRRISVGPHPSTMLLDSEARRLYATCASSDRIAVVDTDGDSLIEVLADSAPGGPSEGSTPNGLALSPDGRRLYVAEADNNAVAVFAIGASREDAGRNDETHLLGRIPVEWYPTAVLARAGSVWVLNGKGRGTAPNPKLLQPGIKGHDDPRQYTLGQTSGSLTFLASPSEREIAELSRRVAVSNHWDASTPEAALPPFQHVVYIIRENRTYDQVLGDLPLGDGDTTLTYFPRHVTPNAHALAERFGVFDRFFVNGEVSGDGHNWTTAAYAADYVEKTIPSNYSGRGRSYDYEGLNRDVLAEDDVNEPSSGYLWDLARRGQASVRNYGEFTRQTKDGRWVANKPWLAQCTDATYPGWDLMLPDTLRASRWLAAFHAQVAGDSMPALTVMWLPNDHTSGARTGAPTPRAYVADNDLALGRVIEAITHSPYWKSTVVFVLEDDAQDGPDHVDSHRSPLLVVSPYNRPGVVHRFANTTDVVMTIDRILHLGALSKFDRFGRPLDEIFAATPDTSVYVARMPGVSRAEVNSDSTKVAALSRRLDFSQEDRADFALLNRVLWWTIKGEQRAYPQRAAQPPVAYATAAASPTPSATAGTSTDPPRP